MKYSYLKSKDFLFSCVLVLGLGFNVMSQSNQLTPVSSNMIHGEPISSVTGNIPSNTTSVIPNNLPNNWLQGQSINTGGSNNYVIDSHGEPCASQYVTDAYLDQSGLRAQFEAEYQQMVQNINYSGTEKSIYTVPVIFHVIHNTAAENVSNAAIVALFNRLNEDYQLANADAADARGAFGFVPANVNVNFCLAVRDPSNNPLAEPGVHRVATTKTYFDPDAEVNDMKYAATGGTPSWDRTRYINVWICDITNGATSGVAGYAYLSTAASLPPSDIDGIVIDYNLGIPPDNSVLTHEMGHFLGLPHTWGNGADGTGCTGLGDGVSDTPITTGPSFNYAGSCTGDQSTCGSTQTQYENFMDYSSCTVMFTTGQASLMQSVLAGSRNSLTTSDACTPVNPTPPVTDFIADITTVISGGTVNFTDQSTNYPTSWSWTITPAAGWAYISGTSSTSQNPKVQFTTPGLYTIELTASNSIGPNTNTKTNYIDVVTGGGGTTACDTLRNWLPTDNPTAYFNGDGTDASWGYLPGTASLDINGDGSLMLNYLNYAEPFTASASAQVRGMRIAIAQASNISGSASVNFQVFSDNAGEPGTVLATQNVSFNDLDEGYWNTIQFATPAAVSGNFWIGYSLTYGSPQDTLVAYMAQDRGSGSTTSFMNLSNGYGWYDVGSLYTMFTSIFMDALLSNGPAPTASLSLSNTVSCLNSSISANAFGSTNATDYEWYFDNGTTAYGASGGSFSFNNLPVGTWAVELIAHGSCLTDTTTSSLTVNPAIVPNITTTAENCSASDGSITVAPTGGDGSGYNVSTNSGATFDSSSPYNFTGLTAGTYTTIINDGTACVDTVMVTVNNVNAFNPTVSPGTTVNINAGASVTLSVTGGVSWAWYEGVAIIGSASSINVSPTTTTTYDVVVTDASGCEKTISITVIVTVLPPVADFTGLPTTICAGETVTFSNATTNAPTSYSWAFTGGTPSTSSATDPSVTYATPGVYNVTLTATNSAGSDVETKTGYITVNAVPTITGTTPATRCGTGTLTLGATASSGTISWYATSTGGSALATGNSYTTSTISSTTTYYVESNNSGCITPTRTAVIATINTIPTITAGTVTNPSSCGNADGSIQVTGSGSGDVSWSGTASGSATSVTLPYTITGLAAGSYAITFNNGTCTSTALNQSLSDPSAPTTPTISAGGSTTFCSGGSVILTSSAGSGNTWSTGATTASITVTTSGNYTVTVGTGCTATSVATVVTVNSTPAIPTISANNPLSFCPGGSVILTSSSPSDNLWSTGETTQSITVTASNASITVTTGTTCTATSSSVATTLFSSPATPTITAGGSTTFCQGDDVVLTSSAASGNTWSTTENTNMITVTTSGSYTVTVTDGNGCTATSSATAVTVNPIPTITGTTPGSRCGTGVVGLGATASAGTISWFDVATGGTALNTGTSFTTPSISATTSYYAEVTNNGCTSPRTEIIADVVTGYNMTETATVCSGDSYTFPDGTTNIITTTMTHNSMLTSVGGCDSIIATTVNVQALDLTVSKTGFTLTSNQNGGQYTWIDCSNLSVVNGATSQSFTPVSNGDYAVILTLGACSDTSACQNITGLSIKEFDLNQLITVSPNPTKGSVNLTISLDEAQDLNVKIYSLIGALVYQQDYSNVQKAIYPIDLSDKENGAYLVRITSETGTVTKRIIVNR